MDSSLTTETIRFTGGADRTGPMTWGQKSIHASIRWLGDEAYYFNLLRVVDVPEGVEKGRVLDALSSLLARHDVLRTHFHETSDGLVQQVHGSGDATVHVTHAEDGAAADVARAFVARLARHTFRHESELPVRLGLVLDHGQPSHVVLAVSHLAVDGWAADLLKQDLVALLAGTQEPAPLWQPLDQAQHESDGPGAARGDAAIAYWRRTVATVPRSLFPVVDPTPRPDRFVRLGMESRALAVAATLVSARCGVSTGTVLLAAAAVVLGRHVGQDRVALQLIASNRLDERSRQLVAALAENALFAVDVSPAGAEGGFATVARRTFAAGLNAYRHAQYDPQELHRFLEQEREGDDPLDLGCFFNDMRIGRDWGVDVESFASVDAVRDLVVQTKTRHVGSWDRQDARYFVSVADDEELCILYLLADTELVSPAEIESLLRQMESVVVEAVAW